MSKFMMQSPEQKQQTDTQNQGTNKNKRPQKQAKLAASTGAYEDVLVDVGPWNGEDIFDPSFVVDPDTKRTVSQIIAISSKQGHVALTQVEQWHRHIYNRNELRQANASEEAWRAWQRILKMPRPDANSIDAQKKHRKAKVKIITEAAIAVRRKAREKADKPSDNEKSYKKTQTVVKRAAPEASAATMTKHRHIDDQISARRTLPQVTDNTKDTTALFGDDGTANNSKIDPRYRNMIFVSTSSSIQYDVNSAEMPSVPLFDADCEAIELQLIELRRENDRLKSTSLQERQHSLGLIQQLQKENAELRNRVAELNVESARYASELATLKSD